LDIMGFRARTLGGVCVVENRPSGGTRVSCFLPRRLKRA
jgi:nitrate/nitrite-specific signal transduction histidine kinase